jgi:hypothetical protein
LQIKGFCPNWPVLGVQIKINLRVYFEDVIQMIESLEVLKTSRKKVKQKADDKCEELEQVTEIISSLEVDDKEEIVLWLAAARDAIKIKGEDEK